MGVDGVDVGTLCSRVAQGLDPAGGGTGPDGDEPPRAPADLEDSGGVGLGGDRALHQRDVVGTLDLGPRHLGEVGDPDGTGEGQQLVFAVEQAELAAVARGELPHGERGAVASVIADAP